MWVGKSSNWNFFNINISDKNLQFILEIIKNKWTATITSIVKLAYLIDYAFFKKAKKQISDFEYIRFHYGPYDSNIEYSLLSLKWEKLLCTNSYALSSWEEITQYTINNELYDNKNSKYNLLTAEEIEFIWAFVEKLQEFSAKQLTEIAYETWPMKAFDAHLWGKEHFWENLDLSK